MSTIKLILFLTLILFSTILNAQISGQVLDDLGVPIEFASIILYNLHDSSMVGGTTSDGNGMYRLEDIQSGHYFLSTSSLGYSPLIIPDIHYTDQGERSLPDLILNDRSIELAEVEVTGKRLPIESTKEGLVLNVQASLLTKGSTVLQLLERSPGITVDRRDGDLKLQGQSGTQIMINGKMQRIPIADLISMLAGMDGSNVKKIELITNPSAKYDAEGGAIINIEMGRSELQGTNASLNLHLGRAWGNKIGVGLQANHTSKQINLFGNYSLNNDDSYSNWRAIGTSISPPLGGFNSFDFISDNGVKTASHNSMVGIEIEWTPTMTVGATVSFNASKSNLDTDNVSQTGLPNGSSFTTYIDRTGTNSWKNGTATIYLRKDVGEASSLSFDADYIHFNLNTPSAISNRFVDDDDMPVVIDNIYYSEENRGSSSTDIQVGVFKLDYQTQLNSNLELETGIKTSHSATANQAAIYRFADDVWQVDERSLSAQAISEIIGAAYVNFNYSLKAGLNAGIGLRFEAWERDFNDEKLNRKSSKLFPSLFLSKKIEEHSTARFSFSRRIVRPSYNDLASFLSYNGPTSVFTGNSALNSTVINNLKVAIQRGAKQYGLFFTHEANPIFRYQISKNAESNLAVITPQNVLSQNSIGVELHLPFQVSKSLDLSMGGLAAHRTFEVVHTEISAKASYLAYNLNGRAQLSLPRSWSMELSGWYTSRHYNGSIKVGGFGVVDLGIGKAFGDHSNLQLTIGDILQSMNIRSSIGDLTQEAFDSKAEVLFRSETGNNRLFRLAYHWTFGERKSHEPSRIRRTTGEEERIMKL